MKRFFTDNSLSIVLLGLFFVFFVGLALTGYAQQNEELVMHGQSTETFVSYLGSGEFIEAVFENWESEFLQMGAFVLLTIWFKQKGSADSKELQGDDPVDAPSPYPLRAAKSWSARWRAIRHMLYSSSLTIAMFTLFFVSMALHAVGGAAAASEEAVQHGESAMSVWEYVGSSQFWFESFQNWQSEFIAVAALIIFSIFLRQRHSPESKPVEESDSKTGE
jgi:hypothetical protein